MGGNWGSIPTSRTPGGRRKRIALSIVALAALAVLLVLTRQFEGNQISTIDGTEAVIGVLLIAGIVWDLRPWRRD